jgi:hypothetical protein
VEPATEVLIVAGDHVPLIPLVDVNGKAGGVLFWHSGPTCVNVGVGAQKIHVTVLDVVAVLPQASTAVNVLVCKRSQPLLDIDPSLDDTVVGPQPSVADPEPRAALISEEVGLQPRVVVVPLAVIEGGTRSLVHVTVLAAVAELPQPSEAVNVLVCEAAHPLVITAPSVKVTIGVPHAAVAVAEPRAAVISDAEGLQPSVAEGDTIMVGGLGALVQVTVLVIVAELPQASTAVNVLVCDALQELVVIAASVNVIVGELQPSVADAEPRALVISDAAGLQPRPTLL